MGVSTNINLTNNVRINDVAKAIAILCGAPKSLSPDGNFITVEGVKARNTEIVTLATIDVDENVLSETAKKYRPNGFSIYYHFETSNNYRLINPGCCDLFQAIGVKLVDFFGGFVDFSDCDSIDTNYHQKSNFDNAPTKNLDWKVFIDRIYALQPLTENEIQKIVNKYKDQCINV